MIKWLFSDIDGTIMPYDHPFSPTTIETIRRCPVPFTLVSGRMPVQMRPMIKTLQLTNIQCGNNGAAIFKMKAGKFLPLQFFPLQRATVDTIFAMMDDAFPAVHYCWYGVNEWFANGMDADVAEEGSYTGVMPTIAKRPRPGMPILALLIIATDAQLRQRIRAAIAGLHLPDLQLYYTGGGYLEMTSCAAGKSAVVSYVCQHNDLTRDQLAAFGDGGNDLALLKAVGWPVAVGNATPAVKAVARLITDRDVDDGVAKLIESWRANGRLG